MARPRPGGRSPRRRVTARAVEVAPELLGPDVIAAAPATPTPSHRFRVLRADDLVVLDVRCFDIELRIDGDGVGLVPTTESAWLEVDFTFQHLLEKAEVDKDGVIPTPPPIPARAARRSRLAFTVASSERIPYSIEGVLDAIRRLPLRVVPLATPRPVLPPLTTFEIDQLITVATLPSGLRVMRDVGGLVVAPPPRGAPRPAPPSTSSVIAAATALRTARSLMSAERPQNRSRVSFDTSRVVGSITDLIPPIEVVRPARARPRAPRTDETSIEAPFRLVISPSVLGGFTHATTPQGVAADPARLRDPRRTELWHTRLGVRTVAADGTVRVDETKQPQKIIRPIWTRELDTPAPPAIPFLASLTADERTALMRQSADARFGPPVPVEADKVYLTSLGSWLELHGRWDPTKYPNLGTTPIEAWDHEATVGRDHYVRVTKPYSLFPFGHRCLLVTITERKTKEQINPQARLYQRKFLSITEPVRAYSANDMPFTQVNIRPLVTPNLDFVNPQAPLPVIAGSVGGFGERVFWPIVDGQKFAFVLDCLDHDGRRVLVRAPLIAVAIDVGTPAERTTIVNAYESDPARKIAGDGQSVAMGPSVAPGDTAFETVELRFTGTPGPPNSQRSTPRLSESDVVVPAMRHLTPNGTKVPVKYATTYLGNGFAGVNTTAQVLLELVDPNVKIGFSGGTERSGGFIQPDLPVKGLSRAIGIVGDVASVTVPNPAQAFNPTQFLAGALPKLFGLFKLTDILALAGLDKAPSMITEQLDKISALLADLESLRRTIETSVQRLADDAASAATTVLRDKAEQARAVLQGIRDDFGDEVDALVAALDTLMALDEPSDLAAVTAAVSGIMNALGGFVTQLKTTIATLPMPPVVKAELERLVGALDPLLDAAKVVDTIASIVEFVNGFDPSNLSVKASFEWRPKMTNFPASATNPDEALFFVREDGFVLSIEARASGADGVGFDALAELADFGLNLFPDAPLMRLGFDRLAFRASSGRKPEVDVVFTGIEFVGVLSFVETLKDLIPFDGFSDPPYVDVSPEGVTAGFDLALPGVAVGVFSLENISFGADARVPFLGDAVTIGFFFCSREKPFRLTVMCIGGGGFVGIRLSPQGLVLLEMSLEATACLSINLGVASGSVSISVGVYLRLEAEAGSLTGYFRIRGEVDVLGLISASITLELSLKYEFHTGKLVGRASISIEVEIFFLSFSVEVSCERRLAGSNSDPTFADFLGIPSDGVPLASVPDAWTDYCTAFAGV
jgi:hypothetical protein